MDNTTFIRKMSNIRILKKAFTDHSSSNFLNDYQRGLRRLYHGDCFGSQEEHKLWLSRSTGYNAGFINADIMIRCDQDAIKKITLYACMNEGGR